MGGILLSPGSVPISLLPWGFWCGTNSLMASHNTVMNAVYDVYVCVALGLEPTKISQFICNNISCNPSKSALCQRYLGLQLSLSLLALLLIILLYWPESYAVLYFNVNGSVVTVPIGALGKIEETIPLSLDNTRSSKLFSRVIKFTNWHKPHKPNKCS